MHGATQLFMGVKSTGEKKKRQKYIHSVVGNDLVSVFVPRDQGLRVRQERRWADDGCSTLSHCLPLLLS